MPLKSVLFGCQREQSTSLWGVWCDLCTSFKITTENNSNIHSTNCREPNTDRHWFVINYLFVLFPVFRNHEKKKKCGFRDSGNLAGLLRCWTPPLGMRGNGPATTNEGKTPTDSQKKMNPEWNLPWGGFCGPCGQNDSYWEWNGMAKKGRVFLLALTSHDLSFPYRGITQLYR